MKELKILNRWSDLIQTAMDLHLNLEISPKAITVSGWSNERAESMHVVTLDQLEAFMEGWKARGNAN